MTVSPQTPREGITSVLDQHRGPWTADDVHALYDVDGPGEVHRYEALDGILLVTPAPSRAHQWAIGELRDLFKTTSPAGYVPQEGIGLAIGTNLPVPDLCVAWLAAVLGPDRDLPASNVLLVVEVESPWGLRRDRIWKAAIYADAGIPWYWRIELHDEAKPVIVVNELRSGLYVEVKRIEAGTTATIERPFRLTIDPAVMVLPLSSP